MFTALTRRLASVPALVLACLVSSVALTATACFEPLSPADVDAWGTHTYAGTTRRQAFKGSVAALKSLGYDTAVVDEGAGRIKSAPKLLVVHASGNQYGARATGSSLAWDIDVTVNGGSAVIRATPRGYEGGQSLPLSRMNAEYMRRTYETLFSEIESNLPAGARHAPVGEPH